jgi:hypothetical protein
MAMNKGLNRARAASAMADEDHGMLRSLGIVETNEAQDALISSFVSDPADPGISLPMVVPPDAGNMVAPKPVEPVVRSTLSKCRTNQW